MQRILGTPEFRRIMILSILCALGILLGRVAAGQISTEASDQLQAYLTAYAKLDVTADDGTTLLRAFAVYFRYCLCIFLLSFTSAGIYLIPLVFVCQGFCLAFAVAAFFNCLAASIWSILSLFALRTLIVLPATLYFGSVAMQCTATGENRISTGFWRRLGICLCALLLGAILEATVIPKLFSAVFQL